MSAALVSAAALGLGTLSAPPAEAAAKPKAKVSIAVSAKVTAGKFATVRGTVKNSKTGKVVKKVKVTVYRQVGGGAWVKAAVVKTNANGKYTAKVKVSATTSFKAKVAKTAKRKAGTSGAKTTVVPQGINVSSVSSRSVDAGQALSVSGGATSALNGTRVHFQYKASDGWVSGGSATIANSKYTVSGKISTSARAVPIRVFAAGSAGKGIASAAADAGFVTVYKWYYLGTVDWKLGGDMDGADIPISGDRKSVV
jgi:5-hydroxyisourate hydrolase-like protein (transthyretin family)